MSDIDGIHVIVHIEGPVFTQSIDEKGKSPSFHRAYLDEHM
jgi:hypothetical protein